MTGEEGDSSGGSDTGFHLDELRRDRNPAVVTKS